MADYLAGYSWTNCGSCLQFLSLTETDCSVISCASQRDVSLFVNNVPYCTVRCLVVAAYITTTVAVARGTKPTRCENEY
jgi:hypothetical protein